VPHYRTEGVRIGDRLLYSLCDDAAGCEPWVTDGTDAGTRRLADVGPGGDSSFPVGFIQSGDFVYFTAYDSRGRELWAIPASALTLAACEDGWDNDGDGGVDLADPGCRLATSKTESPQCNDGVDNDGDTAVDLDDPNCAGQAWRKERPGCGLIGIEGVAFAAAVLARRSVLARRRARAG
jgi:ELWxxDGT repeat protein